ncbi:MAG: hypothetical protein E2P02_07485 [Acidobacteria bacterium]|nr:MAG: hypothetical protein E2P02_07485 [Acidobacteriota bacterium]
MFDNLLQPVASFTAPSAWNGCYDPDRSSRVRNDQEPSSWDAFLDAWRERALSFEDRGGEGLAILTEAYASPSFSMLGRAFRERFPRASWYVYEPHGDENIVAGAGLLTGKPLRPLYHLDRSKTILSLGCDFLLTETGALRHAKDLASARDPESAQMSRLYVVESTLSALHAL